VHKTLERLIAGDEEIVTYFRRAAAIFDELYGPLRDADVKDWAKWLTDAQLDVEHVCAMDRGFGKEIMPWVAMAVLYSTAKGFENNRPLTIKLVQAFANSMCSAEVKSETRRVAQSYYLDQERAVANVLKFL